MLESDRSAVNAEGADDLDDEDIEGSPEGEIHELRTEGVYVEANDLSTSESTNDSGETTKATFKIKYDLTAFEEDFFVPRGTEQVTSLGNDPSGEVGATYVVEDDNGAASGTTTSSASLSSSADQVSGTPNGAWEIDEDETETFTLTVSLSNSNFTGFHNVQLDQAWFTDTQSSATDDNFDEDSVDAEPEEDFETDQVELD